MKLSALQIQQRLEVLAQEHGNLDFAEIAALSRQADDLGPNGTHALSIITRLKALHPDLAAYLRNPPASPVQVLFRPEHYFQPVAPTLSPDQVALNFLTESLGSHDAEVAQTMNPLVQDFLRNNPEFATSLLTPLLTSADPYRVVRGLHLLLAVGEPARALLLEHAPSLFEREESVTVALGSVVQQLARKLSAKKANAFLTAIRALNPSPPVALALGAVEYHFGFISLGVFRGLQTQIWMQTASRSNIYSRQVSQLDGEFLPFSPWPPKAVRRSPPAIAPVVDQIKKAMGSRLSYKVLSAVQKADALSDKWNFLPAEWIDPALKLLLKRNSWVPLVDAKIKGLAIALLMQWNGVPQETELLQKSFKTLLLLADTWRAREYILSRSVILNLARRWLDQDTNSVLGDMLLSGPPREQKAALGFLEAFPELADTWLQQHEGLLFRLTTSPMSVVHYSEQIFDVLMKHPDIMEAKDATCLTWYLSHGPTTSRLKAYVIYHNALRRACPEVRKPLIEESWKLLPLALKVECQEPYARLMLDCLLKALAEGVVPTSPDIQKVFSSIENYFKGTHFLDPEIEGKLMALVFGCEQQPLSFRIGMNFNSWDLALKKLDQPLDRHKLSRVLHHLAHTAALDKGSRLWALDQVLSPSFDHHPLTVNQAPLKRSEIPVARLHLRTVAALSRLKLSQTLARPTQMPTMPMALRPGVRI